MKKKGSISALFTILNIFLITVVLLAGIVFYAGYMFKRADSRVVNAFGYSFHVADRFDVQNEVPEGTFIVSEIISAEDLKPGDLVTVEEAGGGRFSAFYYGNVKNPGAGADKFLFSKDNSGETIVLSRLQIKSIGFHKYHSNFIGRVFTVFSENRKTFLTAEFALFLILIISLIIVIARRESFSAPKKKLLKSPESLNLDELISVDRDVEFEKADKK